MKNFLRPVYLPIYVLCLGTVGFLLRLWTLGAGPNDLGLYAPQDLAWVLLWIVTAVCAGLILLLIHPLKKAGQYHDHFSASLPGAIGNGAAAIGMILTGFRATGSPSTIYAAIMTLLAVAAAIGLCLAAVERLRGNRQPFWAYLIACLFLGLRLFDRCRGWSEVSQTGIYLFPFLASACLLMAFFYVSAMQVELANRRMGLFFSLSAMYLCLICLASSDEMLFYLSMIIFLATNLPTLRPIRKPRVNPEQPTEPNAPSKSTEMSYDELMDWLKNG